MRRFLLISAGALSLAACTPIVVPAPAPTPVPPRVVVVPSTPATPTTTPLTAATRTVATSVINREMAKRLPGVNVAPYTACVVNNATMAELADLAGLDGSAGAAGAVASIVRRPATTQCIAGASRLA